MGAIFDGTDKALVSNTAPGTAAPLSIVAWVNAASLAAPGCVANIFYNATGTDYFELYVNTSGTAVAEHRGTTAGDAFAGASANLATSVWYMVHARFLTTASRYAGLSGANEGSDNSTTVTLANTVNRFSVGQRYGATGDQRFNGQIAHVAIYNADISSYLSALTAKKPQNESGSFASCVACWDFTQASSQLNDLKGTNNLTNWGTVAFDTSGPTFGTVPKAAYFYSMLRNAG